MNITRILQELRAESDRLERAITTIIAIGSHGATRRTARKRSRSRLSAAARKRLSLAKKQWWKKQRKVAKPRIVGKKATKLAAAKKSTVKGGGISAEGRKRLSEMMKKRWAERKKAKATTA